MILFQLIFAVCTAATMRRSVVHKRCASDPTVGKTANRRLWVNRPHDPLFAKPRKIASGAATANLICGLSPLRLNDDRRKFTVNDRE
jgi:hypothetical protein